MGLIKTALIGAAVYGAIKYITKKNETTGKSILDDLKDKAPEWIDKAKGYKQDMETRYSNFANEYPE